ncbi:hypothetical protein BEN49_07105 [Hymenobacter coccineus]|uniref:TPM domain-containing protein n=1 Tax=Hymenobacter coccineus TaxID=1908235 RepID=A0A1G1THF2_9BACT|nr:hypothetical protein BEN49_07105 [Hymenobacter coccineus]
MLLALLFVGALARPAAAQSAAGLPARPVPFQFVTDQAKLMAPADAKKLEGGLRRYADQTGTQVVVVTVPSLGGRQVSDYGRALGTAWGVGQRGKNNGLVVIVAAQEHKVTIQPGSGLVDKITPALTQRVIAQDFGPSFKQNNYFAGLRKGLSTLMLAANPASNPNKTTTPAAAGAPTAAAPAAAAAPALNSEVPSAAPGAPASNMATNGGGGLTAAPASTDSAGPGIGTGVLLIGAVVMGGLLYLLVRMFRRKSADSAAPGPQASNNPNFYPNQPNPNQPNRPGGPPNFLPNSPQGGNYGSGQAPNQGGSGLGMGSILATGAAAAAGAYLGNRMSEGHSGNAGSAQNFGTNNAGFGSGADAAGGAAAGAAGTGAAGDYFAGRGGEANESAPDYFSNDNTGNEPSGDYFSSDDSSYDDTSSDDTGGGGFDDTSNDNSGSW